MKIEIIRHSISHIMAHAVKDIFGNALPTGRQVKFGIGPTIENGFYYDFALPSEASAKEGRVFVPEDLPRIEKRMKELIKQNIKFEKSFATKEQAKKIFKNQPYKLELIKGLKAQKATIYKSGEFIDLCAGPHVKSTREINPEAFKLTKIAGAYWRGDEKNPMLQRIYGVAFNTKKELVDYLKQIEEAEKRDHRILGQKLGIFMIDEEIGSGLPLWLPNGATLRHIIESYLHKELLSYGYQWVVTPHIANLNLWKTSGHWQLYRESMYSPIKIENEEYMLKPMNCPFHVKIYNSTTRSYKELPLRFAELGTVYRYERSGVLHGLTRVRGFTQDDAHIICTPEQLADELIKNVKHGLKMLGAFGFKEINIYLATRPEKYAGTIEKWEKGIKTLKYVLNKLKLKYQVDPGGGVFYGPKIDLKIKDSIGREWQCTTVQFDFNLPEKFDMVYIDDKGKKQRPYMVHRALLGSMERFVGVLLEHYAGALPLWLSPVQIYAIPVGSRHEKYAHQIGKELMANGFRVEVKDENETVSKKIREGEMQRIPYMLVVGDQEQKSKSVRVRTREKGDIGMMTINKFIDKRIKERSK